MNAVVTGGLDGTIRLLDIATTKYQVVGRHTSDDAKSSMDQAEKFLWMNQVVDEKQEILLERWMLSFLKKDNTSK